MWTVDFRKSWLGPIGFFEKLFVYCSGGAQAVRNLLRDAVTYRLRRKPAAKKSVRPEVMTFEERSSPTSLLTGPASVLGASELAAPWSYEDPLQGQSGQAVNAWLSPVSTGLSADDKDSDGYSFSAWGSTSNSSTSIQDSPPPPFAANAGRSELAALADDRFFIHALTNKLDLDLENPSRPPVDGGGAEMPHSPLPEGVGSGGSEGGGGSTAGGGEGGGGGGGKCGQLASSGICGERRRRAVLN